MKCIRDLKVRLTQLRQFGPSPDMTEGILVQVRQLLEQRSYRQEYLLLQFMCHCAVHSDLHNSGVIYKWFVSLNRVFEFSSDAPHQDFVRTFVAAMRPQATKAGATLLQIDKLRVEIRKVLAREALDELVVDSDAHWHQFVRGLLTILAEKPIGLGADRAQWKKHERAYAKDWEQTGSYISSICVVVMDGKFKLLVQTSTRVQPIYTVATHSPFGEFASGDLAETDINSLMQKPPNTVT